MLDDMSGICDEIRALVHLEKSVREMFHETGREVESIDSKENFIRLIRQYQNLVFSICLKMTGDYFAAEDLTQETFVVAYQHFGEFEQKREMVCAYGKVEVSEKAWLCRIATNKCIDYKREAARRVQPVSEEEMPQPEATVQTQVIQNEPLQTVLNHEILEELERCCNSLSPPYKEAAIEYFIHGKTAKEISQQSGIGLKTIQTHIYRAREMLKKIYRKEMLEE